MTASAVRPADHRTPEARHVPVTTRWRWVAAAGTATAAALHVVAASTHLQLQPTLAAGFLLTALVQLGAAAWLVLGPRGSGWDTRAVGLLLTGTVLVVLAFVAAHTTTWLGDLHTAGGHGAHATGHAAEADGAVALGLAALPEVQAPDLLGTATVAVELIAVVGLAALLPARTRSRATSLLLVAGLLVWVAWLTGLLG